MSISQSLVEVNHLRFRNTNLISSTTQTVPYTHQNKSSLEQNLMNEIQLMNGCLLFDCIRVVVFFSPNSNKLFHSIECDKQMTNQNETIY